MGEATIVRGWRNLVWCLALVAIVALVAKRRAMLRSQDCSDFMRCGEFLGTAEKPLEEAKWNTGRYPANLPGGSCPRTGEPYQYEVDEHGTSFTLTCHGHPEFRPALKSVGRPASGDGILLETHNDYAYQPSLLRF